jgi:hypothetical protein
VQVPRRSIYPSFSLSSLTTIHRFLLQLAFYTYRRTANRECVLDSAAPDHSSIPSPFTVTTAIFDLLPKKLSLASTFDPNRCFPAQHQRLGVKVASHSPARGLCLLRLDLVEALHQATLSAQHHHSGTIRQALRCTSDGFRGDICSCAPLRHRRLILLIRRPVVG